LQGVQYEVHGVKAQVDNVAGHLDETREQVGQTHDLLAQHATRIDTVDVRAQDSAAQILRLEAALARTANALGALLATGTALRSRARRHMWWLMVAEIAVVALAGWEAWPRIASFWR